jgi:3-phosphoshikimate 1-carboxyvinyltransferase
LIATIHPGPVRGIIAAPPSKSYTHRALLAGHFTGRMFQVVRPLVSDDTRATRDALAALGTDVRVRPGVWTLSPARGGGGSRRVRTIRSGESGTTLRFTTAAAAVLDRPIRFVGHERLAVRPMVGLVTSLRARGARVTTPRGRALPMVVEGPVRPGAFVVDGSVSSQFVSALLLALPGLPSPSTLRVPGHRVSEPYIDATLAVLRSYGVQIGGTRGRWTIPAPQRLRGKQFVVPGDASSAAYLWAAAAVTGSRVTVTDVPPEWPQADRKILEILRLAGVKVEERGSRATVSGALTRGFHVDLTDAPDLYPLVGVLAAFAPGRSRLEGAAHVVFKESNRRQATIELARALGARVRSTARGLAIEGATAPRPLRVRGLTDHRLVMSAAVAALATPRASTVSDAHVVAKSFPGFWSALRTLGAKVTVTA